MKRWRSVKMMVLALLALFIPAFAMPALCCVSHVARQASQSEKMVCAHESSVAQLHIQMRCAADMAMPQCCCKPGSPSQQPLPRDINLNAANTRALSVQVEQNRADFGPQYFATIVVSAPPVLLPLPQTSERNFQIISPLASLDKSPPAPGRAPPVL